MENIQPLGLSRQIALQREMDIVANNIANASTNGFKRRGAAFAEFISHQGRGDAFTAADRRISYVIDRTSTLDVSGGAIERTGNPTDVAIRGDAFLVVQTAAGERYTRNGALSLNALGTLVTSDGHPVLSEQGPLTFNSSDTQITIAPDGSVSTAQGVRGRLRLASFANPQALASAGANLFAASEPARPPGPGVRLESGAIERANVSPVAELARMMEISRAYGSLATLMQRGDELRRSTLSKLAEAA